MKKLLSYVIAIILSLSMAMFVVGCDDETSQEENVTTGNFKYEIVTGERDTETPEYDDNNQEVKDEFGKVVYEKEEYEYYKITGYTISSDDATKIANGDFSGLKREIVIPKTYTELEGATKDLPIEEIGVSAFSGNLIFTKVTVGDNIKKIGEGAFADCINLKTLEIPFIGKSADAVNQESLFGFIFGSSSSDGTSKVTSVTAKLHQRVDESGTVISSEEDITFQIPTSLESVAITGEPNVIRECAFYGMTTLKNVKIPDTVTEIQNHAFYGCSALLTIEIPAGVTEIGAYAFSNASSLYQVAYKDNSVLQTIGAHAFEGCTLLNSSYVVSDVPLSLPSTVTKIGEKAFASCTSIITVDFKNLNLATLETSVFEGCTAIKTVKLSVGAGNKLVVRNGAFKGAELLKQQGVYVNGVNDATVKTFLDIKTGAFPFDFE